MPLRPRRAVLFAPCFSEYEAALSLKGCEIIQIPLRPEENWLPDARCLERKLERVGGADLVFLGNPNNPTGMALSSEELEVFAGTIMLSLQWMSALTAFWKGRKDLPWRENLAGTETCFF